VALNGRTALVTGAGRGIGREVAVNLARAGVASALVARTAEQLAETVRLVRENGGTAVAITADLAAPGGAELVAERAADGVGPIDILVNNAATVQPLGRFGDVSASRWAAAFDLNVFAPVALAAGVVPRMLRAGWGRVVNVSSGVVARPGFMVGGNAYAATKAALEAHTLNLAAELRDTGVTVNVYRPGSVDTAMQASIREQGENRLGAATYEHFRTAHANGALITPQDSARSLVARLDGDETGRVWDVTDQL
jgi:NAD(P)-dependent dehydrogenase (short-subunit alcohol dehydrogenase family)